MIIRYRYLEGKRLNHSDLIKMEYCAVAHSVREVDHHVESRNES